METILESWYFDTKSFTRSFFLSHTYNEFSRIVKYLKISNMNFKVISNTPPGGITKTLWMSYFYAGKTTTDLQSSAVKPNFNRPPPPPVAFLFHESYGTSAPIQ